MSEPSPGAPPPPSLAAILDLARTEIAAEAEALRADGGALDGLEAETGRAWSQISADPAALDHRPVVPTGPGPGAGPVTAVDARRVAGAARRRARALAGPPLRAVERRAIGTAGHVIDATATRGQVLTARAGRVAAGSPALRGLARLSPSARAFQRAPGDDSGGVPAALETWVLAQLGGAGAVRSLDSLDSLAACGRRQLRGLVLSGFAGHLRASSARATVHLAGRKMAPGGRIVIVSPSPEAAVRADPLGADLLPARPLHPVTWCHLLSRYGFVDLAVHEPIPGSHYAVAARRS